MKEFFAALASISILILMILASGCVGGTTQGPGNESFCGISTYGICYSDSDCMKGGCSGQVCRSKSEEPITTTCEWRDCYDADRYDLRCKCSQGRCRWTR